MPGTVVADNLVTDLLVTCGPCQASVLRGKSVRTNLHSKARLDDEAWAIQYKNLSGHQFFIPVRKCRTWFVCFTPIIPFQWKEWLLILRKNLVEQVCRPDRVQFFQYRPSLKLLHVSGRHRVGPRTLYPCLLVPQTPNPYRMQCTTQSNAMVAWDR